MDIVKSKTIKPVATIGADVGRWDGKPRAIGIAINIKTLTK
jgi:hypothetical protein